MSAQLQRYRGAGTRSGVAVGALRAAFRHASLGLACVLLVSACGGGGGGGSSGTAPPAPPPPPPPPVAPTTAELNAASRLLSRATFGANYTTIDAVARQGTNAWLDAQFSMAQSRHLPIVERYVARLGNDLSAEPFPGLYRRYAFYEQAMTAPDQLRQRVAYALAQIFVVSDREEALFVYPRGLADFYDMLGRNAFGNFRDLLRDVSLHPAMGLFLSHVNNGKANPAANTFPDENYAREVMQLFSIGLFELNDDGSQRLDARGAPIPTYDNDDIREFSRVFTGLSYEDAPGRPAFFGNPLPVLDAPMRMFETFHEPGQKMLLRGAVIPSGQTGMQDIDGAINNLFNHPNVGPFIGRLLIQRLVASNPTPAYIRRVTQVFNNNGNGVRGDMRAVVRAILTDAEAQAAPNLLGDEAGRLREPFMRYVSALRALKAFTDDGTWPINGGIVQFLTTQHVHSAPSVFNFYLPAYAPPGAIAASGRTAPEFQITTDSTIVGITNLAAAMAFGAGFADTPATLTPVRLDIADFTALASDVEGLLDRLDIVFTYGTMHGATRTAIRDAITPISTNPELRARVALYLVLMSPDYAHAL